MEAKQSQTITLKLDAQSGSNIIPLPTLPLLVFPSDVTKISESLELVNFKAYSRVTSIDVSPLPSFELEDTETDRLIKTLDVEWKSPRKQLNVYVGNPDNWFLVGSISLLNPNGYPYRVYDLLQIYSGKESGFIGENVSLAVQIQDVGYGLLQNNDIVSIYADVLRHFNYFLPTTVVNNIINTNGINSGGDDNGNSDNGNDGDNGNGNNNIGDDEMGLTVITANYTLQNKDRILCNNTSNIVVTFPATPSDGWEVEVIKLNASGDVRFLGNGSTIKGYQDSIEPGLSPNHKGGRFVYLAGNWHEHPGIGATITLFNY